MAGPDEPSNDPPRGDREVVPENNGDKIAAEEEHLLAGPQHNDQSKSGRNAVAAPENNNPQHVDADNDNPPPSPASSEDEAAILEQMMRDLGSHRVNDLALDDDKSCNTNGSSLFNSKTKPADVASKATLPVANHGDDDEDDGIAGARNKIAAQNHEKYDAGLEGLDEIDGNEYCAGLQRQLAAEKGTDASRKANSFVGKKGTYSLKPGDSPSHRGRRGFGAVKRSSPMEYSPRRRHSASPSTLYRRNSFGDSEQGKLPPPARPAPSQFSEEQLAAAREMQTMFREPKSPRGRSKAFAIRGNVSGHGGPPSKVSRSPKHVAPSPFQTASKALPATKPASVRSDPIKVVLSTDPKSAAGHPPVSTKFDNSWIQKATAAVASTANPSKASSVAPLQKRSSAGTVHQPSAQCTTSGSSHGTDLVVQTILIKKGEPEEWDDIYDVSPRSRYVPRRDTRSAPPIQDDLVSLRGSSERGASPKGASPKGATRDLGELDDEMFWTSHPSMPQSDVPPTSQVGGGEDTAAIATAAEHDISFGGPSGDSGMLMDFSSPARISAPQAVPAINPSTRHDNIFEFVMSRSLMDKPFEMDNSFEGGGSVDAPAVETSADVEAVVSDETQQQSQSTSRIAPAQASERSIVYQVDQMRDLRHLTHPELVETIAANIPDEVRPFPVLVARQRAQMPVHQQKSSRQVTKRDSRGHQPRPTLTTPVANYQISTQIQGHIRELRSRIDTFDYQLVHHRMDETQTKAVRKQRNRALQQIEGYERYMRGTKAPTTCSFSPKVSKREQSHGHRPGTNTTKVEPIIGGINTLAATGARNASGQGGLAASRWASPEKPTATDTEALPRRLAGLDGDGGEALGELVKIKKLGGLADSKYAGDAANDSKSKMPSGKPPVSIRAAPPKTPTRAGRGRDIISFVQYTESERPRRDASTCGSNRGRGISARGDVGPPGRSIVADENVSPFKGRSRGRDYGFDGSNDDSPSPPSCCRQEPSSPLKSPAPSKKQFGDDSQDSIVAPAFVNRDLPALSDTTNRTRANSIIVSLADPPKRTLAIKVNAGPEASPVVWQQSLLADAHASNARAREQTPETEPTPSRSSNFRTHTSTLSATSGELRPPPRDVAASGFFSLAGYATRVPWAIPQMPASVHQQAESQHVHNDRYDSHYGSDYTYGPMFGYVPPPQLMPVALLPSGPAQGLGPLLMSSNPQSQARMLTGHAYLPDTNNPGQVRRVRCLVRGAPWVDPQTATVRANIIVRADDGEYIEIVGSLNGPPSDSLGNRWFADLFAAIDNLAQDSFFARNNTQLAQINPLGH